MAAHAGFARAAWLPARWEVAAAAAAIEVAVEVEFEFEAEAEVDVEVGAADPEELLAAVLRPAGGTDP